MTTRPDVTVNTLGEVGMLLRAIRGVANCIESASRDTTALVGHSPPPDDAIPAACWAIEQLATCAAKLIGQSVYD